MPGIVPPEMNTTDLLIEDTIRNHPEWSDEQVIQDMDDNWIDTGRVARVRAEISPTSE